MRFGMRSRLRFPVRMIATAQVRALPYDIRYCLSMIVWNRVCNRLPPPIPLRSVARGRDLPANLITKQRGWWFSVLGA
jgi:hypothetical protein